MKVHHTDHWLLDSHMAFIESNLPIVVGFFAVALELPSHLPDALSALYGPSAGDPTVREADVHYICRPCRKCASRLVDKPPRPARHVVVIGTQKDINRDVVIFTAYGSLNGVIAPREPGDTSIGLWTEIIASRNFWKTHALSALNP